MEFKRIVEKNATGISTIEVDKWEPHPEKKGMVRHVGMRTYGDVFEELHNHLEEMGLLPDEYFLQSGVIPPDKELPDYSEAICYVNFGDSEGIYLDVMLASYNEKGRTFDRFATGKTLGTTVEDYYKMSMVCAECSLMLNGRGGFVRLGQEDLKFELKRADRVFEKGTSLDTIIADATILSNGINNDVGSKDNIDINKEYEHD